MIVVNRAVFYLFLPPTWVPMQADHEEQRVSLPSCIVPLFYFKLVTTPLLDLDHGVPALVNAGSTE